MTQLPEPAAKPPPQPLSLATSIDALVIEASRQLTICNACRYCEGFCAVFPALERRNLLADGDVIQLANLCHDCRACFDACMYSPPHEFHINPPLVLSQARVASYDRYLWPRRVPAVLRGRLGLVAATAIATALLLVLAITTRGAAALTATPNGPFSPYDVISYPALLVAGLVPFCLAIAVTGYAARAYWREVGGTRIGRRALFGAVWSAATLRNQRGGGADCYYPDDEQPSAGRRRLHHLVSYGFMLCLISTTSAGVLQDILGSDPPYPLLSVPVITGTLGGIGMLVGCVGLLELKRKSSPVTSYAAMTIKDYGLLVALALLSLTGILVLVLRGTAAYPIAFIVHMATVLVAFASWPYSKFVHLVYRFLALVKDEQELASTRP
jgi:citrate/tricarballylate utilization protein